MKHSYLIVALMILASAACSSKQETIVRETHVVEKQLIPAPAPTQQNDIRTEFSSLWRDSVVSENSNLALTRILKGIAKAQGLNNAEGVAESVKARWQQAWAEQKRSLLLGSAAEGDSRFLDNTLLNRELPGSFAATGFIEPFNLASLRAEQTTALNKILAVYETRSNQLATDLAVQIINEIAAQSPADKEKLGLVAHAGEIDAVVKELSKWDRILSRYQFDENDHVKIAMLGLVAAKLVDAAKADPRLQSLMQKANDAQAIIAKGKELRALVKIVLEERQNLKADLQNMDDALGDLKDDMHGLKFPRLKDAYLEKQTRKELARLGQDILKGNLRPGERGSFISQSRRINANLERFAKSAASAANRIDSLVSTSENVARLLGVKLDSSIQNALSDIKKVTAGARIANAVLEGFKKSGVIGALSVLGGNPSGIAGSLGLDPTAIFQKQIMNELSAIREDLREMQELQRQTIALQMETMRMVRDLASLVEAYHQEEMAILYELKGMSLVELELQRMATHKDIRGCENVVDYVLYKQNARRDLGFSGRALGVTRDGFFSAITDPADIYQLFINDEPSFLGCQLALREVFSSSRLAENPVSLSAAKENPALSFFRDQKYAPLIPLIDVRDPGLFLPAANMTGLVTKEASKENRGSELRETLELTRLISTPSLERYAEALMLMGPLASVNKETWKEFGANPARLQASLGESKTQLSYWLSNALTLVRTAMAQEAILSGEPILIKLGGSLGKLLSVSRSCAPGTISPDCAIADNALLRRNLVTFVLHQRVNSQFQATSWDEAWVAAAHTGNTAPIQQLIGSDLRAYVELVDMEKVGLSEAVAQAAPAGTTKVPALVWRDAKYGAHHTALPMSAELISGNILYSEHMERLIRLYDRLVDASLEVAPIPLGASDREALMRVIGG